MRKKIPKLLALLLSVFLIAALFAGCANNGEKEDASAATTAGTSEATTAAKPNMDGYVFRLANAYYLNPDSSEYSGTAKAAELRDIYAEIETTYNCEIQFSDASVEYVDLYAAVTSGVKHSDFANIHQTAWIPLAVQHALRPLDTDKMRAVGFDVNDSDCFFQLYTHLSDLTIDGETHTYAVDMSGRYDHMYFGHTYAYNKKLAEAAGYGETAMYNMVYNKQWTYDKMLEIANKICKDTDNDGKTDIWGIALDCDGNEIWTNGTGPIIYDNSSKKWIANITDPRIISALEFMAKLNSNGRLSPPLVGDGVATRSDRRSLFYKGMAAFAGLYGKNFGNDGGAGTANMTDPWGLLPIPMGPDADHYIINFVDVDVYCMLVTTTQWEKAAFIMSEIGRRVHDDKQYYDYLLNDCMLGDQTSFKVLTEYLFPYGNMNIAKCSNNMYTITRTQFYADVYAGTLTPIQAAEKYYPLIKAELDKVFRQ